MIYALGAYTGVLCLAIVPGEESESRDISNKLSPAANPYKVSRR